AATAGWRTSTLGLRGRRSGARLAGRRTRAAGVRRAATAGRPTCAARPAPSTQGTSSGWHRGFALSEQQVVDRLAEAAVAPIQAGMLVGLGTGRTARRGVRALAERIRSESIRVDCVASSEGTDRLARELELRVVDFALVEEVDYLFDG